ncbi:hypothetical protein KB681_gp59 [Burkholderia phage Mica]|uniref:Uncharacterized protein n=1 Tax=Burkholderia phage Mica TaxID=2767579 RepID=A0A873WEJ9_9CAUD|nr:hypothetical protein KB681_gp59 [Burkholderia phage Mica]QPB08653.1 hypothetical protein CPT_Mica_041 [Burkholderia phage Mica]
MIRVRPCRHNRGPSCGADVVALVPYDCFRFFQLREPILKHVDAAHLHACVDVHRHTSGDETVGQSAIVECSAGLLKQFLAVTIEERLLAATSECLRDERSNDSFPAARRQHDQDATRTAQRLAGARDQVRLVLP